MTLKTSNQKMLTTLYVARHRIDEEVYLRNPRVSCFCDHDDGLLYFEKFYVLELQSGVSAKKSEF